MEKILLAIDGISPSRKVFRYAVHLCQRLKAELRVLQVIKPRHCAETFIKLREGAHQAKWLMEGSMIAATFAEAGEFEAAKDVLAEARKRVNQLLPESERAGVSYHVMTKSGYPSREIIRYVSQHRDVILAIYDSCQKNVSVRHGAVPEKVRQHLSIPLVVTVEPCDFENDHYFENDH